LLLAGLVEVEVEQKLILIWHSPGMANDASWIFSSIEKPEKVKFMQYVNDFSVWEAEGSLLETF